MVSGQYGGGLDEYEWDPRRTKMKRFTSEERNVDFEWMREFDWDDSYFLIEATDMAKSGFTTLRATSAD